MPTLLARGCSPELAARVKAYADQHSLSASDTVQALLAYALDARDARAAGATAANEGRSRPERRASATRAVEARWYPLRAALLRLAPADLTPATRWMIDALAAAEPRVLRPEISRASTPSALHTWLPSVLPLRQAIWYETRVVARGRDIQMGYLAVGTPVGLEVGYAARVPAQQRIIGPMGPAIVTRTGMERPSAMRDAEWRELRSAMGIVLRALTRRVE